MPEPNTPSPDVSATQQSSGTPATGTPAAQGATPVTAPSLTLEEALKKLADLEHKHGNASEELDRHRKKLSAYEKKEAEAEAAKKVAEEAQLSEIERVQKRIAEMEAERDTMAAELYTTRVREAVSDLMGKFNFVVSAKTLSSLLLAEEDAIEFDGGRPTNIEKLLDKLAKAEPDLVKRAEAAQGTTPTPGISTLAPSPPAVPAMNPGRTNIAPPNSLPPGKIPSLSEAYAARRQP